MELNWISVSDRLPETVATFGHRLCNVLVCCKGPDGNYRVDKAYYLGNNKFTDCHYHADITTVTHWMPLPALPEAIGKRCKYNADGICCCADCECCTDYCWVEPGISFEVEKRDTNKPESCECYKPYFNYED